MYLHIRIHGDFRSDFEERGEEIPYGVNIVYPAGVSLGETEYFNVLCDIFQNASNISTESCDRGGFDIGNFVSGAGTDESYHFRTESGYDFWIEYEADLLCTYGVCNNYCDTFFEELIAAVGEYYKVKFEYYEINISTHMKSIGICIDLYRNQKAKYDEVSDLFIGDNVKYYYSDENELYALIPNKGVHKLMPEKCWERSMEYDFMLDKLKEISRKKAIEMFKESNAKRICMQPTEDN